MTETLRGVIRKICKRYAKDRTRMMDIVIDVERRFGCISYEAMELIAKELDAHPVEVRSVVSFYSFLSEEPKGRIVIRVCNDVVDRMKGMEAVASAFSEALGIGFGETTADGAFTLEYTPCIGMSDQAPAALINDEVFTFLTPGSVRNIVRGLRERGDPKKLVTDFGDGNNGHRLVRSMVRNGIRNRAPVLFTDRRPEAGLKNALGMTPEAVVREIRLSKLRGRGGAGFPTGIKWELTRNSPAEKRFLFCNADEGEPGTFKDRVLLTEYADMLFEGMAIGGYALGAEEGIVYLRGEYRYLKDFLEGTLGERRKKHLLGRGILGKSDFDFEIRIQMGACAYVCGEESALLSSAEGLRGDPKTRPPFPAQKGYLGYPTAVNNVETLCTVSRILEESARWFLRIGTEETSGTKLLSISGDCQKPGVYELPFGTTITEVLREVGAGNAQAVLVGGPSGIFVAPQEFHRAIGHEDLGMAGAVVVFGPERDLLEAVKHYTEFFIEESCGYCTPCRVGNILLKQGLDKILIGNGEPSDLGYLEDLGGTVKKTSRCGLGQTSPNPILTTMANFRPLYEARTRENETGLQPTFSIHEALKESEAITGRKSEIFK